MLFLKSLKNTKPVLFFLATGFLLLALAAGSFFLFISPKYSSDNNNTFIQNPLRDDPSPTRLPVNIDVPKSKILSGGTHTIQTFNNCGPASLSMALSYYGINMSQAELGNQLRPYQVAGGDNDDKSVTLRELAEKAQELGFVPYFRPNGNPELISQFIASDIPVITKTWLTEDEDIGHYRVVKGYDKTRNVLIQDDSLQGKDLTYTYSDFNAIWKKFNYEFLVLVPKEKVRLAEQILGENADEAIAWKNAAKNAEAEISNDRNDVYAKFNLVVALYNTGDYQRAVQEFEQIENFLSFRTLWYQAEPIWAYYELGNYNRVFEISDRILNNGNHAYSELYIIRGDIYKQQGNIDAARTEYEKAVLYNINLSTAQEALDSIR